MNCGPSGIPQLIYHWYIPVYPHWGNWSHYILVQPCRVHHLRQHCLTWFYKPQYPFQKRHSFSGILRLPVDKNTKFQRWAMMEETISHASASTAVKKATTVPTAQSLKYAGSVGKRYENNLCLRLLQWPSCSLQGHVKDDCPEPDKCFNCRQEGHTSADCPEPEKCRKCRKPVW